MKLGHLFKKKVHETSNDEELFRGRFDTGISVASPEEYDANLLDIPIQNIFAYKKLYNEIKLFEKKHDIFSKETVEFKEKLFETATDRYEFEFYCSYLRMRGIAKKVICDSQKLGIKRPKIFKYESIFNILTHMIENFGPNSKKAKECYANHLKEIDNIYDWERFYSYKINNGSVMLLRKKYAKQLMNYDVVSGMPNTKRGGEYDKRYKTTREYCQDTISLSFSKEAIAVVIYKKDILKEVIGAVAYGSLKAYYYKQFGVVFVTLCFLDIFKITFPINTKDNEESSNEWLKGKSNRMEVWLIDRLSYKLRAWTHFDLNAIPTIKRCLRISQGDSTKDEIESNANEVVSNYSTNDFIKLSVLSESLFSDN